MKQLFRRFVFVITGFGALAACAQVLGIDGDITVDAPVDARVDAPPGDTGPADVEVVCNPRPGSSCSVLPQCGCPDKQHCVVDVFGGNLKCVPTGTGGALDRCKDPTECKSGFDCAGGLCIKYCQTPDECPTPDEQCIPLLPQATDVKFCMPKCEPVDASLCGPNGSCNPGKVATSPPTFVTLCTLSVSGSPSQCDPTVNQFTCARGFGCVATNLSVPDAGTCARWCREDAGTGVLDCPAPATSCVQSFPALSANGTNYGVCAK